LNKTGICSAAAPQEHSAELPLALHHQFRERFRLHRVQLFQPIQFLRTLLRRIRLKASDPFDRSRAAFAYSSQARLEHVGMHAIYGIALRRPGAGVKGLNGVFQQCAIQYVPSGRMIKLSQYGRPVFAIAAAIPRASEKAGKVDA
jgi:hypothetical protein